MNSFHDLQRGLKVLPIASTLRALLVKNLAASTYSLLYRFLDFDKLTFVPSTLVNESFFQSLRTSSIEKDKRIVMEKKKARGVSQPVRENQRSPTACSD